MVRSWKWQCRRRRRPLGADPGVPRRFGAGAQAEPAGPDAPPARLLSAEPTYSREAGPSVLLRSAEHRLAVVITADEAEELAREILYAAEQARHLPPQA